MFRRVLILACAATMASACASAGGATGAASATASSHNVISADELTAAGSENVYDTIRRLRPAFFRPRNTGMSGKTAIDVYINGQPTEGVDALRNLLASQAKEVRFYEPQDANVRFGTGHDAGLIAVTLK